MNDRKKAARVGTVVLETVKNHIWLSLTILAVVAGALGAALVPPLVLGRIVDGLTAGEGLALRLPLWYLAFTVLAGGLESARESALTVFGQKTTHALRSRLMEKEGRLPAHQHFDGGVAVQPGACLSAAGTAAGAVRLYPVYPEADAAQSVEKPEGGEPGLRICAGWCGTSAPSGRWARRPTWRAGMTAHWGRATGPLRAPISATPCIPP